MSTGTRLALLPLLAVLDRHGWLSAGRIALVLLLAAAAWVLLLHARPTRVCPRCQGERVEQTIHLITREKGVRRCGKCSGTGRAPRFGATVLHRLARDIRAEKERRGNSTKENQS